jgi:hypothetical protein
MPRNALFTGARPSGIGQACASGLERAGEEPLPYDARAIDQTMSSSGRAA